ncbi:cation:proton antiporter [Thauera sinica]|uniref:Cation:proton antiporter n=1 Tax=Thauera sinica TaxID=2665146 RepID=A0ABW1APS2_9RHOO|nr:cation:proton antiporter [Thauera sp. K11]ATE59519.1 sodium:proton antiporter [Thauera sp. K11]
MNLASLDIFHIIVTLSAILACAHLGGFAAARAGLPPMVGELGGGLLLGATVLERIWPEGHAWLLPAAPGAGAPVPPVLTTLGFCSTIGLLLLLFVGGLQLRRLLTRDDTAAVGWIAATGVIVPVAAGLLLLEFVDVGRYAGSAGHLAALRIVLLIELAITSIPVITRIFLDLGLMHTRLARIVLSVAVIEDVLLYVALSIALGMVQARPGGDASIPHFLGLAPDSGAFIAWHVAASLALLAAAAWGFGKPGASGGAVRGAIHAVAQRSPLAWLLTSILVITGVAMLLGLAPMFGALVAGIVASNNTEPPFAKAQQQVESVGLAFFIPIYFALIGASLDLIGDFDWVLTAGILVFGSLVKYGGALAGGVIAGEPRAMANALAISVNARGGPGLVVASTAFAAGIINPAAYTSLVVLAIATSVGAGLVLARMLRSNAIAAELAGERGRGCAPSAPQPADAAGTSGGTPVPAQPGAA